MPEAPMTVVLVEDENGLRGALTRVLEIAGLKVEAFASAEDCLASNMATHADCLICDTRLPGESEFDLRRRRARVGSAVPVIFIAAHDSGAAVFLEKPFNGRTLIGAVRKATRPPAGP
jgi:two-component system, LuxR family, response regulator FixJ